MRFLSYRTLLFTLALMADMPAILAQDSREVEVHFPAGTSGTSLSGSIVGYGTMLCRFGAEAGQTMWITLSPSNRATRHWQSARMRQR